MKKIFLLPLLSVLVIFSCGNKSPEVDPTHDELSEYTSHALYNNKSLNYEEKVVWKDHHIVLTDRINYDSDGAIRSYGKDTYEYDGNDEIKHTSITSYPDESEDPLINVTTNTYDEHHNIIRKIEERKGALAAYYDYEYTYDNAGNILTETDSYCNSGELGQYNYIATTKNTYDNKSRLLTSEKIATNYDDEHPTIETGKSKRKTTYTYQGDYEQYVTYHDEIHNILGEDKLVSKIDITNELDNHGYPTYHMDEMYEYDESKVEKSHTKTETYAEFYDNGYEYSHQTYDLLSTTDITLIEDYTIYYNNNNFNQVAFEMTYHRSDDGETIKFKKNKYDSKNRLFASEDQEISGGKIQKEHYDTYGYDE